MRLLAIEDDLDFGQSLVTAVRKHYAVDWAKSGKEGLKHVRENDYDLIVLDLGLPDLPGLELCQKIRSLGITTPILILTGQFAQSKDKVSALDCGADDYLIKPIDLDELKARLRALLRRAPTAIASNVLSADDLTLDPANRSVRRGQKNLQLRRKEFDLLEYLLRNRNRVVTRGMILEHVWDGQVDLFTNAIDVHIKYLRDKVDRPFSRPFIKTVHGLGYKLEAQEGGDRTDGTIIN